MHLFSQIQMSYMLMKTLSFIASVVFLIYIIQKGYKLKKFQMSKIEKIKEIGSAWVVTIVVLCVCNIRSISQWLMMSNEVEVFIITLMGIALAVAPILYAYNKYSDKEINDHKENKEDSDKVEEQYESDEDEEDEFGPIYQDTKEELYL